MKSTFVIKIINILDEYYEVCKQQDKMHVEWTKELSKAKSSKDRKVIDEKYKKIDDSLDKKSDKLYGKYYALMHARYGEIPLSSYQKFKNKFMDKKLVYKLEKEYQRRRK